MIKKILCLLTAFSMLYGEVSLAQPKPAITQPLTPESTVPLNRIAAIVNDEIISESDLDIAIDQLKQQLTANNIPIPPADKLRQSALEQLILYRLQLQMAIRNQIKPTDEEIDQTIDQIAQSHHLTTDQLKTQLTLQHLGYMEFRKKLSEQLAINKLQQQMVGGEVKVTDEDIQAYKNTAPAGAQEYRIADFFFPLPEKPNAQDKEHALAMAKAAQQQLNSGVTPDKVTPAYRDLGWRNKDNLPSIFAEQLPTMSLKNASQPLLAPNGYHVLQILEARNPNQNLTDDQIRQLVFRQKYEIAVKTAIEKARNQAYIQIMP